MDPLDARYDARRVLPHLAIALALALVGLAAALLASVSMGWVLAGFMLWTAAGQLRRVLRRGPVLTVGPQGVRDHRLPLDIAWDEVESLRTVDRRVIAGKTAFLELVPRGRFVRPRWSLVRAVLRGDIAVVDARDDRRLMLDLGHLDVTPEQVMAAARAHR